MIELDGRDEEEIRLIIDDFAARGRNVAFAGSKVKAAGGSMGTIVFPLAEGPEVGARRIALVGAAYTVPGEHNGGNCCPHFCSGWIEEGAPDLVWQGRPVVMVGHRGSHWPSCGSRRAPAVVVEGWKIAYWSGRDTGLSPATAPQATGMSSANLDATFAWFRQVAERGD